MRVRLVRRPGQHGTKQYVKQYGDRLLCVRYRYDAAARRRYKTVEIIVEESEWAPPLRADTLVGVRVVWGEVEVARQLRAAGALWRRDLKLWQLRYDEAVALGFKERITGALVPPAEPR